MKKLLVIVLTLAVLVASCSSGVTPTSPQPTVKSTAAKLVFTTQPAGAIAGSALSTQPAVTVQDSNGNTVSGSFLPVTLAITSGTGTSRAVLFGPSTINAASGVARFTNLSIDKVGTYTLTATSGKLESATSLQFTISPGAPARLEFTVQPGGGVAGSPFTVQPEVTVQDVNGNNVTDYEGSITLAITLGSASSKARLSGTTTVAVVKNVAKFTDVSISMTWLSYTLTATSGGLALATSTPFAITPGAQAMLEITVQPAGAKAGSPFDTQPIVAVEDVYGNVVTKSKASITLSITPGTGAKGAILSGKTTLVAEGGLGGLADFTDLSINSAGTGYTLTATCAGLTSATSAPFDVAKP